MTDIRTGFIAFVAGGQSEPHLVNVNRPLTDLSLRLTGNFVVTTAATLTEDSILRLVRRIQITRGGDTIKSIGNNSATAAAFRMYNPINRSIYSQIPEFAAPGVGVATNAFAATIKIPFSLPSKIYSGLGDARHLTMLDPKGEEIRVVLDFGVIADIFSAGGATLTDVRVEVIAHTQDNILTIAPNKFREVTHTVIVEAGANAQEELELNKNGVLPFQFVYFLNNGLRSNAQLNRLRFKQNAIGILKDASWEALRQKNQADFNLQGTAPVDGTAMILHDIDGDLTGALDLDNPAAFSSYRLELDHDALTAPTFIFHNWFID